MAIKSIELKNFTVFEQVKIPFSSGVNVFIGENGTGKTHLLKVLYAASDSMSYTTCDNSIDRTYFASSLKSCFGVVSAKEFATKSASRINKDSLTEFIIESDNGDCKYSQKNDVDKCSINCNTPFPDKLLSSVPVFIPAKDMLTHARGLLTMSKRHSQHMPFDKTLLDVVENSETWKVNTVPKLVQDITPILEKIMEGVVIQEDGDFFILKNNGDKISFASESEGIKKFGLLWQLLMTDSIKEDGIIFWDEPEANINPMLISEIVKILLQLAKSGVQIFIASHSYFLPQYFEVFSAESDDILFHALYKTDDGVQCETSDKFTTLDNNKIVEEKINLYDAEVEKVLNE